MRIGRAENDPQAIEIVQGVAVARHGQQRVVFASNVNEEDGAITLSTQDGVTLRSSILALRSTTRPAARTWCWLW